MRRLFSEITHLRFFLSDELDYSGANPGKYACSGAPRIRTGSVAVPQQERTLPISRQHLYHTISFQFFCFLWDGCGLDCTLLFAVLNSLPAESDWWKVAELRKNSEYSQEDNARYCYQELLLTELPLKKTEDSAFDCRVLGTFRRMAKSNNPVMELSFSERKSRTTGRRIRSRQSSYSG